MLGRINATMRFAALSAALIGTLLGGVLGEMIGVRPVLLIAALGTIFAAGVMALSPIRRL
jgi:MFS family permease